jgi:2-polyprenyl-6-hydroxyphenyl methylase/3-demethylubiquinone-9 3-methyltransferase
MPGESNNEYEYRSSGATWDDSALWREVRSALASLPRDRRIFEIGCGNGTTAARLHEMGFSVTAVDPSKSGIEVARRTHSGIDFSVASIDDDLARLHGRFACVVSLEVIEHCYSPKRFAAVTHDLLKPGGIAIISTPYHGYLKNLALAITGKMDAHFTALWEGGHIKFFSMPTLRSLFEQHGFEDIRFSRVGRIPPLAKSMLLVALRRS